MPVDQQPLAAPPAGDDWLACVDAALDPGAAPSWAVVPSCGAVVTFTGTARDHADGRTGVTLLEYEAYEEHVVPVLRTVAAELRRRHPDLGRVALWHRTGALAVTDVAVVVAVSTPHRDAAFEAARWAIDEVKAAAPIWKREHHDGGVDWGRCDHREGHGAPVERHEVTA
ncbi:molybdenum cofactor biosynthesis protein MoaE [Aquihabitans sp. G128]|uniref:molybdopterin synthase catalytic subunit n=1 Tax=Aquihabitans sp. G128 TaxID=2849779 RepID=UPI001C24189B|nr:molybdenum cofactor biosynthesis protein MoaE [Aquihabitans sp. G128]QXC60456.1 molybdenum cofactor biosynthesis protein MoaE [Aquihabitans sp. G128]